MPKIAVIVSPNYKNYAERFLTDCLASLREQTITDFKLFLVDNESTPASLTFLKKKAPEAEIISLPKNEGFAGGNNAALTLALKDNYDYAFLINMDALADKDCLEKLVNFLEKNKTVAAVQPRIMLWPQKDLINSLGNETHFLGFGYCQGYNKKFNEETGNLVKPISYASGAGVLFRLSALKQVGLFDEEFWMYNEDQDICLRLWLAGFSSYIYPEAVMYHKYEFNRSISKYYWMDRNRVLIILKNYHWLTILAILPVFIVMEFGLILFSLKSGWFKEKMRIWKYFFSFKSWQHILVERSRIQAERKINDRTLTKLFSGRIWYQEIDDPKLRFINPVFSFYWRVVRLIMFW